MATAKKCDRCGEYYEKNENNAFPFVKNVKNRKTLNNILAKIAIYTNHHDNYQEFDLCDSCAEELRVFFWLFRGEW